MIRISRGLRSWQGIGVIAAIMAAVIAVLATPSARSAVTLPIDRVMVGSGTGAIFAEVRLNSGLPKAYLSSSDGGRTWSETDEATAASFDVDWQRVYRMPDPPHCAEDGTCYRLRAHADRTEVEILPAGTKKWLFDGELPAGQMMQTMALNLVNSEHVVAALNSRLYFRQAAGVWLPVTLGEGAQTPNWLRQLAGGPAVLASLALSFILIWFVAPPGRRALLIVPSLITAGTIWYLGIFVPIQAAIANSAWPLLMAGAAYWLRRSQPPTPPAAPEEELR